MCVRKWENCKNSCAIFYIFAIERKSDEEWGKKRETGEVGVGADNHERLCARHRAAWHSLRASVDPGCHPSLLRMLSSFPSLLPSYPRNRETCAGLFMLFLWHFHPRSEVCSRRMGTGGEAGVADELKSTRLALKLAPWRGSSLVAMARHKAVSTGGPSVRLLEPSWWEVNPRNTSVLGSECVFVDVDRQDEGKSAPCVFDSMWAFQPVRFRARLSWLSAPTPTSPVSLFLPQ